MTISKPSHQEIYVWIWLPGQGEPVPAGKLSKADERYIFNYGRSYLENQNAIPIHEDELPLIVGPQERKGGTETMPGCIRDSAPDAWGRRVILNKLLGRKGRDADPGDLDEITYLMESGSDRIGALDFQQSATEYVERTSSNASLDELLNAAELVEAGVPLTPELAQALNHGTSIGGARPKALITEEDRKYIAKFSASNDTYNIIKAEYVAMQLAQACGLNVASTILTRANGKDVLLVERFDREKQGDNWTRKLLLSSLTLMGLDEMTARYASYQDFAEIIRHKFANSTATLKELFARMVFNILCSNTDDHARNHAGFWDGNELKLTPAYDICPQLRTGGEASQSMLIYEQDNNSLLTNCLKAAPDFMLDAEEAKDIIEKQLEDIKMHLDDICKSAELSEIEMRLFNERLFLPDYALTGWGE